MPYLQELEQIKEQHERVGVVLLGGDCTSHGYRHLFGTKGMNLTKGINNNGDTHNDVTVFSTYAPLRYCVTKLHQRSP